MKQSGDRNKTSESDSKKRHSDAVLQNANEDNAKRRNAGISKKPKSRSQKNVNIKEDDVSEESSDTDDDVSDVKTRDNRSVCGHNCQKYQGGVKSRCNTLASWIAGIIVGLIFFYIHQHELLTHQGFSRFWLNWENVGLQSEVVSSN